MVSLTFLILLFLLWQRRRGLITPPLFNDYHLMELPRAVPAQGDEGSQGPHIYTQTLSSLSLWNKNLLPLSSYSSLKSHNFHGCECSPTSGSSRGITLLWKINVDVRIFVFNSNLINALFFSDKDELPWQFTGVYDPPILSWRRFFLHVVYDVASNFIGPWLLLGDFNTVLVKADKFEGRLIAFSTSGHLNGLITEFDLPRIPGVIGR